MSSREIKSMSVPGQSKSRIGKESPNVTKSGNEEGNCLREEVKVIAIFPVCNITATAEEKANTDPKL